MVGSTELDLGGSWGAEGCCFSFKSFSFIWLFSLLTPYLHYFIKDKNLNEIKNNPFSWPEYSGALLAYSSPRAGKWVPAPCAHLGLAALWSGTVTRTGHLAHAGWMTKKAGKDSRPHNPLAPAVCPLLQENRIAEAEAEAAAGQSPWGGTLMPEDSARSIEEGRSPGCGSVT